MYVTISGCWECLCGPLSENFFSLFSLALLRFNQENITNLVNAEKKGKILEWGNLWCQESLCGELPTNCLMFYGSKFESLLIQNGTTCINAAS